MMFPENKQQRKEHGRQTFNEQPESGYLNYHCCPGKIIKLTRMLSSYGFQKNATSYSLLSLFRYKAMQ